MSPAVRDRVLTVVGGWGGLTTATALAWMHAMRGEPELTALRAAALDAIVAGLREAIGVDRCTLRIDVADEVFPVRHESRTPQARTLIEDRSVDLRGQPVVEALLGGTDQVVQTDTSRASDDPAFHAMLASYGGLGAQIVTAVRVDGRLLAIISLHHLGGPREWSRQQLDLAGGAAGLVAGLLTAADWSGAPDGPREQSGPPPG